MSETLKIQDQEIVSYQGENWRIIHVEDFERVLAKRIADDRHDFLPIAQLSPPKWDVHTDAELDASQADVTEENAPDSALTKNAKRLLDRAIRSVTDVDALPIKQRKELSTALQEFQFALRVINAPRAQRSTLIAEMCETFNLSVPTAYRHVRIVKKHRSPEAILRASRSDSGKIKVPDEVQNIIRENLKKYRFVPTPKTLPSILILVNGEIVRKGLGKISLSTLTKHEKETTLKQKLEKQGRKSQVKNLFGSKVGELPNKDYPLSIIQVDHTPLQVCLVDEIDRLSIGDPWLTLVIDCYSRMVLGYFLTFDPPSTLSTGVALSHAFLPKEDYLHNLGVTGEWPCWGFPDVILVDNAAELNGRMMHSARKNYRFTLRDRPVGSPNFGGHVESAFRTFMFELKSIPGTKFSNPIERAEYDSENRAILTLAEFEQLFAEFLVNDYHLNEHGGKGMKRLTPILKWKKGVFEGDIMPPTGLPERPTNPLALRISLLPFEMRTIRNGIVNLFGEEYHGPSLTLIGDGIDLTKPLNDRLYELRYDPRDISKIWMLNPDTNDYLEMWFTDLRKGSISLWEHRALRKRRGTPAEQFLDQRYDSMLKREEIKATAAKRTRLQRLADEKSRRHATDSLVTQTTPAKPIPPNIKKELDPESLRALRDKVRPASVKTANKK